MKYISDACTVKSKFSHGVNRAVGQFGSYFLKVGVSGTGDLGKTWRETHARSWGLLQSSVLGLRSTEQPEEPLPHWALTDRLGDLLWISHLNLDVGSLVCNNLKGSWAEKETFKKGFNASNPTPGSASCTLQTFGGF